MLRPYRRGTSERGCAVTNDKDQYPATVDAAVRLLQSLVPAAEQEKIRVMAEGELWSLHFGLGQWARNHLGLWGENAALLEATGEASADDASGVVLHAFWEQLRSDLPKLH